MLITNVISFEHAGTNSTISSSQTWELHDGYLVTLLEQCSVSVGEIADLAGLERLFELCPSVFEEL